SDRDWSSDVCSSDLDDHIAVPQVPDLVREDRADLVLVQSLQEALRDDELRRGNRAAEDEGVRRIIPAHPDLGRRHARLAGGFLDGPIYPRICLGRDWTPATN